MKPAIQRCSASSQMIGCLCFSQASLRVCRGPSTEKLDIFLPAGMSLLPVGPPGLFLGWWTCPQAEKASLPKALLFKIFSQLL